MTAASNGNWTAQPWTRNGGKTSSALGRARESSGEREERLKEGPPRVGAPQVENPGPKSPRAQDLQGVTPQERRI